MSIKKWLSFMRRTSPSNLPSGVTPGPYSVNAAVLNVSETSGMLTVLPDSVNIATITAPLTSLSIMVPSVKYMRTTVVAVDIAPAAVSSGALAVSVSANDGAIDLSVDSCKIDAAGTYVFTICGGFCTIAKAGTPANLWQPIRKTYGVPLDGKDTLVATIPNHTYIPLLSINPNLTKLQFTIKVAPDDFPDVIIDIRASTALTVALSKEMGAHVTASLYSPVGGIEYTQGNIVTIRALGESWSYTACELA